MCKRHKKGKYETRSLQSTSPAGRKKKATRLAWPSGSNDRSRVRRRRTSATGSIPGRRPGALAWAGTAPWFPCRTTNSWSSFRHAHAPSRRRTGRALGLAALAAFGLVLEVLVGEEVLFARGPHELCPAIHATEQLVLELHRPLPLTSSVRRLSREPGKGAGAEAPTPFLCLLGRTPPAIAPLVGLAALLLARTLPCQRLLRPAPVARLQVERGM